jgi:hypothetical protein
VRVELSSIIARGDINLGKVTNTRNLNVILGLHEMNALECSVRNHSSTTSRLGAPRDLLALSVTNSSNTWGSPHAKVVDIVEPRSLAHGRRRVGRRIALVRANLSEFRLVGWVGSQVPSIPDLVRVFVTAGPDLGRVAIVKAAVRKIDTLA